MSKTTVPFPCWGPVWPISRGEMLSVLVSNLDIKVKSQFSKIPIELPSNEPRFGPHRIVWLLEQTSKRVWYNCLFSHIWAQHKSTLQKNRLITSTFCEHLRLFCENLRLWITYILTFMYGSQQMQKTYYWFFLLQNCDVTSRGMVSKKNMFLSTIRQKYQKQKTILGGGFNPFENLSQIGNLPQIGVKIDNIWKKHHPWK